MRRILLFFVVVSSVYCKEETASDLYELLNNPALMSEIEKRLGAGNFDDAEDLFSDIVGCYDTSGMISTTDSECNFSTNSSSIIKTEESIKKGAVFLMEFVNISCPRDCTVRCCDTDRCDTAVYQDKGERKCYLFHCGDGGTCEFSNHADYWTGTISTKSQSYMPSGAPQSHENELENLSSHVNDDNDDEFPVTSPPPPPPTTTTTVKTTTESTTTSLPLLGYPCPSYGSQCMDPHAECLMKFCRCRVGYHEKYGKCRKHCRSDQFECDKYEYYSSANSRECIPNEFVCDGNKDCIDASDELNCKDKTKQAYLEGDVGNGVYNNPFFNTQYNQQQDPQYQYGLPIPGLANQQAAGLFPQANQIYPGQVATNQNAAGQYYVPGLANQNQGNLNLANQGSPINQQWPLSGGIGPQVPVYQNNVPVQYPATGQQQTYIGQPGYIQNALQPVQPVGQNIQQPLQNLQQIQQKQVPNIIPNQKPAVGNNAVTNAPVQPVPKVKQSTASVQHIVPDTKGYVNNHPDEIDSQNQDQDIINNIHPLDRKEHVNTDDDERNNEQALERQTPSPKNYGFHQAQMDTGTPDIDIGDLVDHRHSSEDDEDVYDDLRTYPPATKTKTQIGSPTQSTVSGQKTSHTHSEGFADYPWMNYDSGSPRVSGKKGNIMDKGSTGSKKVDAGRRKKPIITDNEKSLDEQQVKDEVDEPVVAGKPNKKPTSNSRFDNQFEYNRYNTENKFPDDYRNYDDFRAPVNNRRPSYDRYNNRYEGTRRRPSPGQSGSRYPYYPDSGYPRGRDRYPVWDPYKDEYYYPDDYEDRQNFDFRAKTDEKEPPRKPGQDNNGHQSIPVGAHPDRPRPVNRPQTTIRHYASTKAPTTEAPIKTEPTKTYKSTDSKVVTPVYKASSDNDQNVEPVNKEEDKSIENQSADSPETKNSNNTDTAEEKNGSINKFNILNADSVEVASYTDSFQGPIVALALGLAITLMLLIIVGCRLRTVKRRLRKGRALHSNEADYLINGMYL